MIRRQGHGSCIQTPRVAEGTLTQPPVVVDDRTVLAMVEVKAAKSGQTLHNFAAHLLRVANDQVAEWWMVEAKPAESDRFWS